MEKQRNQADPENQGQPCILGSPNESKQPETQKGSEIEPMISQELHTAENFAPIEAKFSDFGNPANRKPHPKKFHAHFSAQRFQKFC